METTKRSRYAQASCDGSALEAPGNLPIGPFLDQSQNEQFALCPTFRATVARQAVSIDEISAFYDTATSSLVSATAALAQLSDDGELLRGISSLVALSQLAERASRVHALLSYVFATGEFPPIPYAPVSSRAQRRTCSSRFARSVSSGGKMKGVCGERPSLNGLPAMRSFVRIIANQARLHSQFPPRLLLVGSMLAAE